MEHKLSVFFEWVKLVQRIIMVVLTIGLMLIFRTASYEIRDLKNELQNIAKITETTRQDVLREIDEIQKNGIVLHFRLW